jgi:hypothetical protein
MKTMRVLLALLSAMTAAIIASAQTVSFVLVGKEHSFTQTNTGTVVENASNNWTFTTHIEGTGLTLTVPSPAPSFSAPAGSTGTTGAMTFEPSDNQWRSKYSFTGAGSAGQALLDAAYNNGTYNITAFGATISPSLTGDSYTNTPMATLSAGTWSGGILYLNPGQALTITTNTFAGYSGDHIGININAPSYNQSPETFVASSLSATILSGDVISGRTFTVDMAFDKIIGFTTITGTSTPLDGGTLASIYTVSTSFTVQVIPEPATMAELFGVVALAGAIFQRRRRLA